MKYEKYYDYMNVKNKKMNYINRFSTVSNSIGNKDKEVIASLNLKKRVKNIINDKMPYNVRYSRKTKNFNDAINDKLLNISNYSNIN